MVDMIFAAIVNVISVAAGSALGVRWVLSHNTHRHGGR